MASAHRRILVHRRITVAEHLNIPHTVFGDGAAPRNFPCLLLHGFGGLVVVDATVMSMCCFPDKEFHMRNPLGVHLTSMAVLGQHMVVDDQPCQHINAHTHSKQVCFVTLIPLFSSFQDSSFLGLLLQVIFFVSISCCTLDPTS